LHSSDIDTLTAQGVVYLDQANYIEIIKYYDKGGFDRSIYRDLFENTLTFLQVTQKIRYYYKGGSMLVSDISL
jgi:hypothetical protein